MKQKFDQDFRNQAVKMALERKISQKQLAADLGIGHSTLASWIQAYKKGYPGDFQATSPNKKWCGDLFYTPLGKGVIYLSLILDLHSRKVESWALEAHMKHELVIKTLEKAIKKRTFSEGLIFHSDRGSQYRSTGVRKLLEKQGIKASHGLSAYDNAAMESFFGS